MGTQVLLTECRRRSQPWLPPPSRSRSLLPQRGSTLYGSVAPSWPLCPPSSRCGSLSRSMMSLVLLSCTESASKCIILVTPLFFFNLLATLFVVSIKTFFLFSVNTHTKHRAPFCCTPQSALFAGDGPTTAPTRRLSLAHHHGLRSFPSTGGRPTTSGSISTNTH